MMICSICAGTGSVMGGGMMPTDCEICDGSGIKKKNRRKEAVNRIRELDPALSEIQAERIFDEEMEKLS